MMKVQDNKITVKVIQTTKGHLPSPFSNKQYQPLLTIFNQLLIPQVSQQKTNLPLDLQHLNHHRLNPHSLQNTSIPWASFQHQLRDLLAQTNYSQKDILIFDSSNYNQKIPQIFKRFYIVKGFNYRLKLQSLNNISQNNQALMQQPHVLKQIQMEFTLGNGSFKPGYIGQIYFQQILNPTFAGIINAYMNYASQTQCPIVLNFASQGQQTYDILFQDNSKQIIQKIQQKLQILRNFLQSSKYNNSKNIIIYNLPILILHHKQLTSTPSANYFHDHLQNLIAEFNITLGFKLLRYSKFNEKDGIHQIIKLAQKHPNNIILSSGIKYKTDLKLNTGQGLCLYTYNKQKQQGSSIFQLNSIEYIKHFLTQQVLERVVRQNILELFDWKQMKEQIKVEVFWKCDNCKGDFSQKVEAFQKFGKRFCSIKCLKTHKF